jgi:hypothetical protein
MWVSGPAPSQTKYKAIISESSFPPKSSLNPRNTSRDSQVVTIWFVMWQRKICGDKTHTYIHAPSRTWTAWPPRPGEQTRPRRKYAQREVSNNAEHTRKWINGPFAYRGILTLSGFSRPSAFRQIPQILQKRREIRARRSPIQQSWSALCFGEYKSHFVYPEVFVYLSLGRSKHMLRIGQAHFHSTTSPW